MKEVEKEVEKLGEEVEKGVEKLGEEVEKAAEAITIEVIKSMTVAVEAGSAGEQAAKDNGLKANSVASQADALMEVASGTSDAAIIDLLMAGAMIGEGTSYPELYYTTELTKEEYGVGCRKGSDLVEVIDSLFKETYESGKMKEIATKYGVQEAIVKPAEAKYDYDKIKDVDAIKAQFPNALPIQAPVKGSVIWEIDVEDSSLQKAVGTEVTTDVPAAYIQANYGIEPIEAVKNGRIVATFAHQGEKVEKGQIIGFYE
ncbi:MAG: transporter substrate-binding domain-containing protein [Bacteroidales bacterium]|nr:transporter substrate-binding domain-containing protein [Bacteroidales bacterium]